MGEIKVYKMNDYELWASKLSIEETNEFYEQEMGIENDINEVEEVDIDKEGLWWELFSDSDEYKEAILKLGENDKWTQGEQGKERTSGDIKRVRGSIYKWITLREAIGRYKDFSEPFCIGTTEI